MKANIKPRIDLENRTKLEDVIPLETPFVIFLDPSDICNFQCKFCPTGDRNLIKKIKRKPCMMNFDLFKKIINDLRDFEKPIKVLRLYKDGEPFLNPKFSDMVRYSKESGCVLRVDTTTNGSLLNPKFNIELIESNIDRIIISVEGLNDEFYKEFANYKMNFNRYVENIRHLYENKKNCEVYVKIIGDNLSHEEKQLFYTIFGDIADYVFIEHIAPCWPNYKMKEVVPNSEVGIYGQDIKEVEVCPYIFYSLSINSDGKVSLCFLDWTRKLIIGDVKIESFKSIWNGEKLFEYRKMHLMKKRKNHSICGNCGQLSHCLPDNIDPFTEILLKRLEVTGYMNSEPSL